MSKEDGVVSPLHYTQHPSGVETRAITRWHNNQIGNVIKYAMRNGLKDGESSEKDIKKLVNYGADEIMRITTKENLINYLKELTAYFENQEYQK